MSNIQCFVRESSVRIAFADTGLLKDVEALWKSGSFCDVQLVCDDGFLVCHSAVLAAASPLLRVTFSQAQLADAEEFALSLPGIARVELGALLGLLYAGEAFMAPEHLDTLLSLACALEMPNLINVFERAAAVLKDSGLPKKGEGKDDDSRDLVAASGRVSRDSSNSSSSSSKSPVKSENVGEASDRSSSSTVKDVDIRRGAVIIRRSRPSSVVFSPLECRGKPSDGGTGEADDGEVCDGDGEALDEGWNSNRDESQPVPPDTAKKKGKENGPVVCRICGGSFVDELRLLNHEHRFHGKELACPKCGETGFQSLSYHMRKHHPQRRFPCPECGKRFNRSDHMKEHLAAVHRRSTDPTSGQQGGGDFGSDPPPRYRCDTCHAAFTRRGSLRTHLRTHSDRKHYVCPVCGKGFKHTSTFGCHVRTHSAARDYSCDECGMSFKTGNNLRQHRNLHAGKQLVCSVCGKKFARLDYLKRHAAAVHKMGGRDDGGGEGGIAPAPTASSSSSS